MKITFLVGNGFDISCGLETSYMSFYKWYVNQSSVNEAVSHLKESIDTYLKIQQKEYQGKLGQSNSDVFNWSDLEMALGEYTDHFTVKEANDFLECYSDVHGNMIQYLADQQSRLEHISLTEEIETAIINGLRDFWKELSPKEQQLFSNLIENDKANDTQFQFISFNYTLLLDKCIAAIAGKPIKQWQYNGHNRKATVISEVTHIHGDISRYPILGVDNQAQIKNQELLNEPDVINALVKHDAVDAVGELWHVNAESLIHSSSIICIWGMSIGDSDARWWKIIDQWLNADSNRHIIIYWYSSEGRNTSLAFRDAQVKDRIKKLLLSYSGFDSAKQDGLKNRIHVIVNTESVLKVSLSECIVANAAPAMEGSFAFDYSSYNGEYIIGSGQHTFHTKWSKASDSSIHAYSDGMDIDAISLLKAPETIDNISDFSGDYTSRTRTPRLGDAIIWRNKNGAYAVTKITSISDDSRGAANDKLECVYKIYA